MTRNKQTIQTYIDAFKSGNPEKLAAFYEEGAMILPSGHEPSLSTEGMARFTSEFLGAALCHAPRVVLTAPERPPAFIDSPYLSQ